ncbi:MAG TPA: agglutinin biogenesis protein MshI [Noviherbaspirillum sp.]|nr:agglutinin biogenesis protein MshI [Noviherbaspirillum sp.]
MPLFAKSRKLPGWLAFTMQKDGLCTAYVKRLPPPSLPKVEAVGFQTCDGASRVSVLEKLAKDFQASRHECTTLLASAEYQLLSVDAPNVPPDELKTAIRWRLKDMLDYHIDDATIDVLDVPVGKNAPARSHSMYAVTARNQVIELRQAMFSEAKIPLKVIDIPEMAQRNISALLEAEGRGLAMLSFDGDGGLLTVTFGGDLYLSRWIDISVEQLLQPDASEQNARHERITLELQRSLDHVDRQYHFITVAKLVLAPVPGDISGLRDYLVSNLYVPVEVLRLEDVLDLSAVPELRDAASQQRYFMTLGAALRHEEKAL